MTDQERLDAIDDYVDKARNLSAGLKEDGRPEVTSESEDLSGPED